MFYNNYQCYYIFGVIELKNGQNRLMYYFISFLKEGINGIVEAGRGTHRHQDLVIVEKTQRLGYTCMYIHTIIDLYSYTIHKIIWNAFSCTQQYLMKVVHTCIYMQLFSNFVKSYNIIGSGKRKTMSVCQCDSRPVRIMHHYYPTQINCTILSVLASILVFLS